MRTERLATERIVLKRHWNAGLLIPGIFSVSSI